MKNSVLKIFSLLLGATALLSSCKKDDSNSFKNQLVGHWESVDVKANDADLTSSTKFNLLLQTTYEFDLDLTTSVAGTPNTIANSGDWVEDSFKQDVTLTYNGSGAVVTYDVKSLSAAQMEVEYTQDGVRYAVKFKRLQE